jgi:hypothetical protein
MNIVGQNTYILRRKPLTIYTMDNPLQEGNYHTKMKRTQEKNPLNITAEKRKHIAQERKKTSI